MKWILGTIYHLRGIVYRLTFLCFILLIQCIKVPYSPLPHSKIILIYNYFQIFSLFDVDIFFFRVAKMAVNVKTEPPGIFSCINVNVMDDDKEKSYQMRKSMIKREGVDPKFRRELKVDVGAGNFQNVSYYIIIYSSIYQYFFSFLQFYSGL